MSCFYYSLQLNEQQQDRKNGVFLCCLQGRFGSHYIFIAHQYLNGSLEGEKQFSVNKLQLFGPVYMGMRELGRNILGNKPPSGLGLGLHVVQGTVGSRLT